MSGGKEGGRMSKKYRKYNKQLFEKLWNKLENKGNVKSKLFYFSLFDYMGFEEPGTLRNTQITQKFYQEMVKEIKKILTNFFHMVSEQTFKSAVATDYFTKNILCFELRKKGFSIFAKGPNDLLCNNKIKIEIKRFVTTRQLSFELDKLNRDDDGNKLLLLFFFPLFPKDDLERITDLVRGYYCLEKYYGEKLEICVVDRRNFKDILNIIEKKLNSF